MISHTMPPGERNLTGTTPGSLTISQPSALHREMMDARALAGGARFGRLGARVVLDECQVDHAVAQMPRRVVAHPVGAHLGKAEHFALELRGALEVIDLQPQFPHVARPRPADHRRDMLTQRP